MKRKTGPSHSGNVQEGFEAWARHERLKEQNRRQLRGCLIAIAVIAAVLVPIMVIMLA